MAKETNHLQEIFLTRLYRTRTAVTMFLMNGYQLRGIITGFDAFVVVLTSEGAAAGDLQARDLHHYAGAAGAAAGGGALNGQVDSSERG